MANSALSDLTALTGASTAIGDQLYISDVSESGLNKSKSIRLDELATAVVTVAPAFVQSGSGPTATTVQAQLRLLYNLRQFAAVGDGTTNDTTVIQAAIDAVNLVAGSSGQKIILDGNGLNYSVSSISVKQGVILKNVRLLPSSASATIVKLQPGGEFHGIIDVTGVTFSGKALSLDTDDWALPYDNLPGKNTRATVDLYGTAAQGTALYLHDNSTTKYIAFVDITCTINGFSTGIDVFAENVGGGFVNGNTIRGVIRASTTMITTRGAGAPGGNLFYMTLQPVNGQSARGWYIQTGGSNILEGFIWDTGDFSTSAVEFGASAGADNKARIGGQPVITQILNSSASASNSVLWDWGAQYNYYNPLAATTKEAYTYLSEFAGGMWVLDVGAGNTAINAMSNHIDLRVGMALSKVDPTYGVSVAINLALGNFFKITVTDGVAFTIASPSNVVTNANAGGHFFTITVSNTSGGAMGVITWGAGYKMSAWTNPATGFSRSITFWFDGTNYIQCNQTGVDVPN